MDVLTPEDCANGFTGDMLKRLREELGLSRKQFEEMFPFATGRSSAWEKKGTDPVPTAAVRRLFIWYVDRTYEKRKEFAQMRAELVRLATNL